MILDPVFPLRFRLYTHYSELFCLDADGSQRWNETLLIWNNILFSSDEGSWYQSFTWPVHRHAAHHFYLGTFSYYSQFYWCVLSVADHIELYSWYLWINPLWRTHIRLWKQRYLILILNTFVHIHLCDSWLTLQFKEAFVQHLILKDNAPISTTALAFKSV